MVEFDTNKDIEIQINPHESNCDKIKRVFREDILEMLRRTEDTGKEHQFFITRVQNKIDRTVIEMGEEHTTGMSVAPVTKIGSVHTHPGKEDLMQYFSFGDLLNSADDPIHSEIVCIAYDVNGKKLKCLNEPITMERLGDINQRSMDIIGVDNMLELTEEESKSVLIETNKQLDTCVKELE